MCQIEFRGYAKFSLIRACLFAGGKGLGGQHGYKHRPVDVVLMLQMIKSTESVFQSVTSRSS